MEGERGYESTRGFGQHIIPICRENGQVVMVVGSEGAVDRLRTEIDRGECRGRRPE